MIAMHHAVVGHVGDSRCYRIRDRLVSLVSKDHTVAQQHLDLGTVTPEEVDKVPFANTLTRAVGIEKDVTPDTYFLEVNPGDQFLLCSDGLHSYITDEEIASVFTEQMGERIVPRLVACANARGGRDNITTVAVRVASVLDEAPATQVDLGTDFLAGTPLFAGFEVGEAMGLLRFGRLRTFIKDEAICVEGDNEPGLSLILAGKASTFRRGTWLATIGPGGVLGETSFIDGRPCDASAKAEEEVRLVTFDREKLLEFLRENTGVGFKLLKNLSRFVAQRCRDAEGRLSQAIASD